MEILAGEMVTGRRLTTLPITAGGFTAALGANGEVTCTIPLRDREVRTRVGEFFGQLEPWRSFLACQVGTQIGEAGPIVAHDYDDTTGNLTVKAIGLRGMFAHRLAVDATAAEPQKTSLSYGPGSLGTIGKRLVQRSLANPGGTLPIVLPPDEGGTDTRTYPGHELVKIDKALADLSDVEGGPEFSFEPRLTSDGNGIEWVMRTGITGDPLLHQSGDDWPWDPSASGGVMSLSVGRDASTRTNSVWVTGMGMDTAILLSRATGADEWARGYPLLESTYSHSTVGKQATLDQSPPAYRDQGSAPWTTWSLQVARDTFPTLGEYRPGDWAAVHIGTDHAYLQAGVYRSRIVSIKASAGSAVVDIELRPTLERR
ncbi:hypothetical protein [Occultella gossypii]|uniref:Phage tail protein n=1 Tax=Occultella gossypii TaxID=2800820 RepID=A0ABS7SAB7_9MICO|nr:hypothetical protein [Occultella gossypii]MBZ2197280.1 hypothetical protein [Occultella gossypii]